MSKVNDYIDGKTTWENNQDSELGWEERYNYEVDIIIPILKEINAKSLLDIGSGPGKLTQKLYAETDIISHLIDTEYAFNEWNKRKYYGVFFIKDLENNFDISELNDSYDFIIINDFLEHIRNPSMALTKSEQLLTKNGRLFISVPNWRMGHVFIYPGLFDYDNILDMLNFHGFELTQVYGSNDKIKIESMCYPIRDSESKMPESLKDCWNFYFICKKISDEKINETISSGSTQL